MREAQRTRGNRTSWILVVVLASTAVAGCRYRTPVMSRSDIAMMNERHAADALNWIARSEELWRVRDSDGDGVKNFYVADLAFLETQIGERARPPFHVPEALIRADVGRFGAEAVPYHGYYFSAMERNSENVPYRDAHRFQYGFTAWPATYRDSGVRTFILDQDGHVWARDHAGGPQVVWPEPNPVARGWVKGVYSGWPPSFPPEQ